MSGSHVSLPQKHLHRSFSKDTSIGTTGRTTNLRLRSGVCYLRFLWFPGVYQVGGKLSWRNEQRVPYDPCGQRLEGVPKDFRDIYRQEKEGN